ncbi:MAG: DUF1549 and DUF1553 domain-containing protein [Gemmataceae bacterium]|nr:DUF1549 and DUF1553 domain-containing protein [Gemmataceae bacterium]
MSRWLETTGRGLAALALLASAVQAAAPSAPAADPVAALTKRIDQRVDAVLKDRKIVPAPRGSDSEFVRRAYLDLAGRIPRVSEVRAFLADKSADKRRKLIDKLLDGANYVNHFSNVWRNLLLPDSNNQQAQFFGGQIEGWVRSRIRDNARWDQVVRDLVGAELALGGPRMALGRPDQGASAYFQANEMKPDNLAASTSRLFLGVKIECAQCHDHPFAKWTRKQFWEYAAFFGGIRPQTMDGMRFTAAGDDPLVHEIAISGSTKKAQARFLDGKDPRWEAGSRSRAVLAAWITSKDNPFFARAMGNRLWEHFFGVGLVDPVDDFREENPASHPELVDDLAKGFVESGFDAKFLIRAIAASEAYQRTAEMTHASQDDVRAFSRMPIKGLTPEQVFDSLATAVGYRGDSRGVGRDFVFGMGNSRTEILARFANPVDRKTEYQTSILQALALMNGRFVADATSLEKSETLAAIIDLPSMGTREKLDALHLAALARPMRGSEAARLIPYVDKGGPTKNSKKALSDVFWVLLNSSEFILNH